MLYRVGEIGSAQADAGSTIPDEISPREKFAFILGSTGASLAWNLTTAFLVFYYSDVAGIPLAVIGTLMLVTRILDGLFDPIAGVLVDMTRTRWGKARPYLLFVPVFFAIFMGLTFSVPEGSVTDKTIYACVTFTLLGLLYSFFKVPFGALMPAMVRTDKDKISLASLRSVGVSIGAITIYALAMPVVKLLGQGDQALGFSYLASLAGAFCAFSFLLVFFFCRERNTSKVPTKAERDPSARRFGWVRNQIWGMEIGLAFSMFVRMGITVACTAFYAKSVLRDVDAMTYLLPLSASAPLLAGMLAPLYLGRFGIRRGNVLILALSTICYLAIPLVGGSLPAFLAVFFLANLSIGINTASLFIITADACDLQQHREGLRREGVLGSTGSFFTKVGGAVGGAILAFGLSFAGYKPDDPNSAVYMVELMFWLVPAIICAGQALFMSRYRTAKEMIAADEAKAQAAAI